MVINILEYLEESARKYPNKIAVLDEKRKLTYCELIRNAKKIGSMISKKVDDLQQVPFSIWMDKSCECLEVMLGVLYSGNFYVPLDPKSPTERLKEIFKVLDHSFVIGEKTSENVFDSTFQGVTFLAYESLIEGEILNERLQEVRRRSIDTDLMYVLFTSGSTGTPKGVALSHRSVIDYVEAYVETVAINEMDVLANQSPFYFDFSLKDIYMAQKVGATLCIIPSKLFMQPKKLMEFVEEHKCTVIAWVPTAYRIVSQFKTLEEICPDKLHTFIFSGESMPIPVFKYWKKHYSEGKFIQQYGPTEITGACTSYSVNREFNDGEIIPIGRPFKNTGLFLLDENDQLIEESETENVGEICVKGTCLARGYYNDVKKTRELFVQNPLQKAYPELIYRTGDLAYWNEEKELVFVSRKDFQIKHSGHRIELGEIERAVQTIDGIDDCCCVQNRKCDELVLYYVSNEKKLTREEIFVKLKDRLPRYMIPNKFILQEQLQLLSNGKIDRKKMDLLANE